MSIVLRKAVIPHHSRFIYFPTFFVEEPDLGAPLKIDFPMAAGMAECRKLPPSVHIFVQNKKQHSWKSLCLGNFP